MTDVDPRAHATLQRSFSRRRLLALAPGGLLLVAGLAACGGDDTVPATSTAAGTANPALPTSTAALISAPASPTSSALDGAGASPTSTGAGDVDGPWSFTDDRGSAINLPARPERVVAQTSAAAVLWDFGFKVVGIYGPSRLPDGSVDFQAGDVDLDEVAVLGDYGELDLEQLVALKAQLYIDMTYGAGTLWYLGDDMRGPVEAIVPTLGIAMAKVSIVDSIARFEELAGLLGADTHTPELEGAKTAFAAAEGKLKIAIAAKPGLKVLVISPSAENVYIASPDWMTDLYYFRELGLDIVTHQTDDFFELLSWEQIGKYPADLILVDERFLAATPAGLDDNGAYQALPAVKAGQVGKWYAGAPYSYKRLVPILDEMTELIGTSRADVV